MFEIGIVCIAAFVVGTLADILLTAAIYRLRVRRLTIDCDELER